VLDRGFQSLAPAPRLQQMRHSSRQHRPGWRRSRGGGPTRYEFSEDSRPTSVHTSNHPGNARSSGTASTARASSNLTGPANPEASSAITPLSVHDSRRTQRNHVARLADQAQHPTRSEPNTRHPTRIDLLAMLALRVRCARLNFFRRFLNAASKPAATSDRLHAWQISPQVSIAALRSSSFRTQA
jgi:hypothetical protein